MRRNVCLTASVLVLLGVAPMALAAPVPPNDAKAAVQLYFRNLEKGVGDSDPLFAPPAKDVIAELGKVAATGTEVQQSHALRMIGVIGQRAKDKDARRSR